MARPPSEPEEDDQPVPDQHPGVEEGEPEQMPHVPDESNLPGGQPTGPG